MSNLKDQPAFPKVVPDGDTLQSGMTMRQYFAGLAMQGIISHSSPGRVTATDQIAKDAIDFADALIAELEKQQP